MHAYINAYTYTCMHAFVKHHAYTGHNWLARRIFARASVFLAPDKARSTQYEISHERGVDSYLKHCCSCRHSWREEQGFCAFFELTESRFRGSERRILVTGVAGSFLLCNNTKRENIFYLDIMLQSEKMLHFKREEYLPFSFRIWAIDVTFIGGRRV